MSEPDAERVVAYLEREMVRLAAEAPVERTSVRLDHPITKVVYRVGRGSVEFLYGPPEYRVEIFVSVPTHGRRTTFDLARFRRCETVLEWWRETRPTVAGSERSEKSVVWYVDLLLFLKGLDRFAPLFAEPIRRRRSPAKSQVE